jgi:hypothetical protein
MSYYRPYDSPEYRRARAEREVAEQQRAREEAAAKAQREQANREARAQYQARLQAEQDARQAAWDAQVDAELAAIKQQEARRWLADHPDQDAVAFERMWATQLRAYHVEQRREAQIEQKMAALRASGRYSL